MSVSIHPEQMTLEEKIEAMEILWADLSRSAAYAAPAWHVDELRVREELSATGRNEAIDWETAKRRLRDECR